MRLTNLARYIILCGAICTAVGDAPKMRAAQKPPAGYLRIWHFAPSLRTPISLSLTGAGASASSPLILMRTIIPSNVTNYREVPPGQYQLHVRAASKDLNITEADPEVLPPVTISVGNGTFQTIVLQDQGNSAKLLLSTDTTAGTGLPIGAKRLRIFNFAPGQMISLKTIPQNEIVSSSVPSGVSEHIFASDPGTTNLVMTTKLRNGQDSEQNAEISFKAVDSMSALIIYDRYGRLSLIVQNDAKKN